MYDSVSMKKEDLLKIIESNTDSYVQIIKSKHKDFYDKINIEYSGKTFGEKLYKSIHTERKCKVCNTPTKFKSFIVGVAGKLLNHFIKNYNPYKIITYADKRYSVGNLYEVLGFNKIKDTKPNYWYFELGNDVRWHRYGFAKHTLSKRLKSYDATLSEWDNMKNNRYDRIWDCGHAKYQWIKPE
jgi:hypothetical protein